MTMIAAEYRESASRPYSQVEELKNELFHAKAEIKRLTRRMNEAESYVSKLEARELALELARDEAAPWDELTDEEKAAAEPTARVEIHGKRDRLLDTYLAYIVVHDASSMNPRTWDGRKFTQGVYSAKLFGMACEAQAIADKRGGTVKPYQVAPAA
jgi:hypothetical protein